MSVQALSWALAAQTGSVTRKAVLISLANCHNAHTGNCYPRVPTIAREANVSDRTVQRALKDLEAEGFVTRHETLRADGSQGSNHYTLHMSPSGDRVSPHEPELEPSVETYVSTADAGNSAQKTPLDLLWDACEEHVQKAPTAKTHRSGYAKLVREMLEASWTPEMVRRRAKAYRKRFPQWDFTLAALAKWGEELDRGKRSLTEGTAIAGHIAPVPSVNELPREENLARLRQLAGLGVLVEREDSGDGATHGDDGAASRSTSARTNATAGAPGGRDLPSTGPLPPS